MNCKVLGCRFSYSHTTSGHKCGRCGEYGHGVLECRDKEAKENLKQYRLDFLPKEEQCLFPNCRYKWSHSCISHHCHKCGGNHKSDDCGIIRDISKCGRIFNDFSKLIENQTHHFMIVLVDEEEYIIRNNQGKISVLSLETSYTNKFINGYNKIFEEDLIKCPLCRTVNLKKEVFNINGLDSKCSVCLDENINKFFKICGHACVCNNCFLKL